MGLRSGLNPAFETRKGNTVFHSFVASNGDVESELVIYMIYMPTLTFCFYFKLANCEDLNAEIPLNYYLYFW